ncbi:ATP phosphoribosyltransferase regulatory subunit [Candidatus Pacearchaeota archaeon]|nr:ATP phosphoribosyltransferase regulatory subunit [Candidatus Pacearchaeota archaeon]
MTEPVKGFKDYSGKEAIKREEIRKILVETFERYGFEPVETPIVEQEEFVRGENVSDEAVSDIFKLQDKGKRNLALRYEFTFQLKRLMKNKKLPYKRYQIGEVFRDEPISANRFRQFTQCDVDVVGSGIRNEAEVLALTNEIMITLGIKPLILINNRGLLNEILQDCRVKEKDRLQVLREIDKYGKISDKEIKQNLKKYKAEKVLDTLKQGEEYFNKFQGYKQIIALIEYCKLYGVKVKFSPTVIRGLSYYNENVFEVKAKNSVGISKDSIVAGGSYMFNGIQCTGISFGLERISTLAKLDNVNEKEKILVVSLGQDKETIGLAQKLRKNRKVVSLFYGKPTKALEYANSYGFQKVIFVGEKEIKAKKFKVKNMKTGKESELKI